MARHLIFFLWCGLSYAIGVIEVTAKHISSNQSKGEIVFTGDVLVQKEADILYADKVVLQTGKDRKPSKYTATGNVRFGVKTNDGRKINGNAREIIYDAKKDEYYLSGKARVEEEGRQNAIKGEEIVLNRKDGSASVTGDRKKPAKIIFSMDQDGK